MFSIQRLKFKVWWKTRDGKTGFQLNRILFLVEILETWGNCSFATDTEHCTLLAASLTFQSLGIDKLLVKLSCLRHEEEEYTSS